MQSVAVVYGTARWSSSWLTILTYIVGRWIAAEWWMNFSKICCWEALVASYLGRSSRMGFGWVDGWVSGLHGFARAWGCFIQEGNYLWQECGLLVNEERKTEDQKIDTNLLSIIWYKSHSFRTRLENLFLHCLVWWVDMIGMILCSLFPSYYSSSLTTQMSVTTIGYIRSDSPCPIISSRLFT